MTRLRRIAIDPVSPQPVSPPPGAPPPGAPTPGAVAFGAAAAGAASAGAGSEPSVTSPAFIKFAAMPGHSGAGTEVPVIAVSKKQKTRYFVMTGHTGT